MANNYSPAFPVNYSPNGDTTAAAFWKHIQEILRIYSLLEYMDESKIGSGEVNSFLQEHINSSNPHPNWKPKIDGSQITGRIDASLVYGNLVNANIHYSRVTDLQQYIQSIVGGAIGSIPPPVDKGDGIVSTSLNGNGFVKFKNGFIIQWGSSEQKPSGYEGKVTCNFPVAFPGQCLNVLLGTGISTASEYANTVYQLLSFTASSFEAYCQGFLDRNKTPSQAQFIAFGK